MPDYGDKEGKQKNRRETLIEECNDLGMPQCTAIYLIEHLFDIGLTLGDKPITHGELESYQRNMGIKLTPWEIKSLKKLSEIYLVESRKATDKDAETPWEDAPGYMSAKYRRDMRVRANNRKLAEMR